MARPLSILGLLAFSIGLIMVALLGAACGAAEGGAAQAGADERLQVVASTAVVGDWARELGGDRVAVTLLAEPGADEHTLQLGTEKVIAVSEADLVLLSGGGLEQGFEQVVRENARGPVIDLSDGIDLAAFPPGLAHAEDDEDTDEHRHRDTDPHYWLDPERAQQAIRNLQAALAEADPASAATYEMNADRYIGEVQAVDRELQAALAALPEARRTLVSFHDAYGYFASRYGLEILGFVVEGPEEEPSAEDIAALVAAMRERGVAFIFKEPQFSARVVERIAAETGATVRELYAAPSGAVTTYLDVLRANAAALSE